MNQCKKNVSRHVSTIKRYERISNCWLSYENPPFQCSLTNNDASNGAFSRVWGNSLIWTSEQLGNPLERMEDVKPYPTFKLWAIRLNDPESLSFDQYLYCLDLHLLGRSHGPLIHRKFTQLQQQLDRILRRGTKYCSPENRNPPRVYL